MRGKVMPENGRLSKDFIKKLLRSEFKMYYTTPELNDILYLHYKGIDRIQNLEEFTGLKVLYIEGNGLKAIEGLQYCTLLRCLYMQENLIKKMEGIDLLVNLVNLNLSDNLITKIEGLSALVNLGTLLLKRNQLGRGGLDDLIGLLECPSLSCVDVQENHIEDSKFPQQILQRMPNMAVVYSQNNPYLKQLTHYRKRMINWLPGLKYLDDKPVFDDERRFAEAWNRGGLEEERRERQKYKQEKEQEHLRNHLAFKEMIQRGRAERLAREALAREDQDASSESQASGSLQTYNTPSQEGCDQKSNSSQKLDSSKQEDGSEKEPGSQREKSQSGRSQKSRAASQRSVRICEDVFKGMKGEEQAVPELQTPSEEERSQAKGDVNFMELD